MTEEKIKTDKPAKAEEKKEEKKEQAKPESDSKSRGAAQGTSNSRSASNFNRDQNRGRNRRNRRNRSEGRARPEFDQKIVDIRRVARVMAGGRRFSFSVCLIAGDKRGRVGAGLGKATDTSLAIEKAFRNAKKNMITVSTTDSKSIAHEVESKYCGSSIIIAPAPGKGVKAGGAVRTVIEMAGLNDVSGKILSRSKNHINNARATLKALEKLPRTKEAFKKASSKK